jgi:hypothetical protein
MLVNVKAPEPADGLQALMDRLAAELKLVFPDRNLNVLTTL